MRANKAMKKRPIRPDLARKLANIEMEANENRIHWPAENSHARLYGRSRKVVFQNWDQ